MKPENEEKKDDSQRIQTRIAVREDWFYSAKK